MTLLLISGVLAAASVGTQPDARAVESDTVYRYTDSAGVEHYVNRATGVPAGAHAERVDLSRVTLNPETARALDQAAKRARQTAETARATPPQPSPELAEQTVPADARRFALWAAGMTALFVVLVVLRRATRREAPGTSALFAVLRFAAGALALMGWAGCVFALRDSSPWLAQHVPPLRALSEAHALSDQVAKQRADQERSVDEALKDR